MKEEKKMEIDKRNLVSTISECLKEHQVNLKSNNGDVPMYLIEVNAPGNLELDFLSTYAGEVDDFKQKLAKKIFKNSDKAQSYGVLIDEDLKYTFAFNRKFGDINIKDKKISFKSVEDVLVDSTSTNFKYEEDTEFPEQPVRPRPSFRPDTLIRYSLTGKKDFTVKYGLIGRRDEVQDTNSIVSFDKENLLDRIKNFYSENTVVLDVDGKKQKFFAVNVKYNTSTLNDFQRMYDAEIDDFKIKLAKKTFGFGKTNNEYVLLINQDMQIAYVYNTKFAEYDKGTNSIKFVNVEDALLDNGGAKKDITDIFPQRRKVEPPKEYPAPRRPSGHTRILYCLQGKKE
jgi:hypothetical protein